MTSIPHSLKILQFCLLFAYATYVSLTPYPPEATEIISDKIIHAAGYFLLYFSSDFAFAPNRLWLRKFLLLFAYSGFIEVCQYFIPNRSCSLLDMVANLAGLLLGLGACIWVHRLRSGSPDA